MAKEIRFSNLEFRNVSHENNEMILEGYATVFNKPTVIYAIDGIEYKEMIDRHAFDNCSWKDCCLKYNHSDDFLIMARTRGGSLELRVDDYGLFFRAKLFNTQASRDVYEIVKAGGLDQCSFAFIVENEEYDSQTRTRTITKISDLYDVAICPIGAYGEATSVTARSFFELENEKERMEIRKLEEAELNKRKLKLKLELEIGGLKK